MWDAGQYLDRLTGRRRGGRSTPVGQLADAPDRVGRAD